MRTFLQVLALVLSSLASIPSGAYGQDYMPFPDAAITPAQWQAYFDLVRAAHGASEERLPDRHLVLFTDSATDTYYAFTTSGNPAHPAWITRRIVEIEGRLHIRQIGYFAGDEASFAALFDAYQALNERIRQELENQR